MCHLHYIVQHLLYVPAPQFVTLYCNAGTICHRFHVSLTPFITCYMCQLHYVSPHNVVTKLRHPSIMYSVLNALRIKCECFHTSVIHYICLGCLLRRSPTLTVFSLLKALMSYLGYHVAPFTRYVTVRITSPFSFTSIRMEV